MSDEDRLPWSATFTSSSSPRRSLVLGPIFDAGSLADSNNEREPTACNERRGPLPGHAAAICVPKGVAAFHANRSVRGPTDFNVAMVCRAWLQVDECAFGAKGAYRGENVPLNKHASNISMKTSHSNLERFSILQISGGLQLDSLRNPLLYSCIYVRSLRRVICSLCVRVLPCVIPGHEVV